MAKNPPKEDTRRSNPSVGAYERRPSVAEALRQRVLFSEEEASVYLNLSVAFLRKCREGVAPIFPPPSYIKIGNAVRYPREDLDKWLRLQPRYLNRAEQS